jgi:hypothetical protein
MAERHPDFVGRVLDGELVYSVASLIRRWHQQRTLQQFQAKLLDRIGSVSELGAFLNTESGSRFLKQLTTVNEAGGPHIRILRAVESGAVLATLGIGLYLYGWMTPTIPGEVTNGINALATIFFGIGAGFLGSAALSYRLSKQMGLLSSDEQPRNEPAAPTI